MLLVPPFWFHALQTDSRSPGVLLTVARPDAAPDIRAAAAALALPAPLRRSLAQSATRASARGALFTLVRALLRRCLASSASATEFVQQLLFTRYWALPRSVLRAFAQIGAESDAYVCSTLGARDGAGGGSDRDGDEDHDDVDDDDVLPNAAELPPAVVALHRDLINSARAVCAALDPLPGPVATLLLQDYVQDVVLAAVGLEHVPGFLYRCFVGRE